MMKARTTAPECWKIEMNDSASQPEDAEDRRKAPPVVVYKPESLPEFNSGFYAQLKSGMQKTDEITVPPRDARCFHVPAGCFFRICSIEGPQVGDLNLWNAENPDERFFSGKTRALHGTHVTRGHRLWSNMPYLRPMASITEDTLAWYGWDEDGGGVHDVIGTRCDPYTNHLLNGTDYHYCCHSNLTRAFSEYQNLSLSEAEPYIHDVLNVFMCTGFTHDSHQYFMKASPVRPGDYLEFFAEIGLICGLSTCPGGDCGSGHSDDEAICHPLLVEIYQPPAELLEHFQSPETNGYSRNHGVEVTIDAEN